MIIHKNEYFYTVIFSVSDDHVLSSGRIAYIFLLFHLIQKCRISVDIMIRDIFYGSGNGDCV